MILIRIFLSVLFFLFSQNLYPQQVKFEHIRSRDGISQNVITCIAQDELGLMWIGTEDGLNQYNGYEFKIYRKNVSIPNSLSGNFIECIAFDKQGRLWCGSHGGGLSMYNRELDNWENFQSEKKQIPSNNISDILVADDTTLYVSTFNAGVFKFSTKSKTSEKVIVKADSLLSNKDCVFSILLEDKGQLWMGYIGNVLVYSTIDHSAINIPFIKNGENIKVEDAIRSIIQDSNNDIWVATEFSGLYKYDPVLKQLNYYKLPYHHENIDNVRVLYEDDRKNLWIGFDGAGLGNLNLESENFSIYQHSGNDQYSLSNNTVYAIYQSNDGIIWVGNYGGGVNVYNDKRYRFNLLQFNPYKPEGLGNDNVRTLHEDKEGILWMGTRNGLDRYDPEKHAFEHYSHEQGNPNSISSNIVLSILEDSYGKLWIGTFSGGLNQFDRESGTFKHYYSDANDPTTLSNNNVYSIYEDSDRNLWIGTLSQLSKYNRQTGTFTRYSISGIRFMLEDSLKRFYIGSSNGLFLFDKDTGSAVKIWPLDTKGNMILYIHEDHEGELWVGTKSGGLLRFSANRILTKIYTVNDGMPNDVINTIVEDDQGFLWISTNKGICKFDKHTEQIRSYDYGDGLQGNEFNTNSGLMLKNGTVYFGGINGLNFFKPDNIIDNTYVPKVMLTNLKISNQRVTIAEEGSPLEKNISVAENVNLKYFQSDFTFEFVALNFTFSEKNQYAYMLEGFEDKWNYVGNQRSATYTNIPAGKYVFRVKASNNDMVWNNYGTSIDLSISPPFWKTWYAILFYSSVIIFLLLMFKRYALIPVKVKNKLLIQRIENEKREELNQLKLAFFTNISHEFRTPLTLVVGPLEKMLKSTANESSERPQLELMLRNANRLLMLVNQLMDFRKIDMDKMQLKLTQGDICLFIKEIWQSFESLARDRHISYSFFSEKDSIITWFDSDALEKVIYNLLSNAFKYTPESKGEISVFLSLIQEPEHKSKIGWLNKSKNAFPAYLQIIVKDNGIGIEKDKLEKIFERFYVGNNTQSIVNEGTGIGLALAKSFVELHMGKIWSESEIGEGSRFYIRFPIISEPFNFENNNISFEKDNGNEHPKTIQYTELYAKNNKKEPELISENDDSIIVLIVEDNPDLREFIKSNMKSNYRFIEASNGEEGFDIALKTVPDIVICDVMMPVMDGLELCSKLKSHGVTSHIPLILLTAKDSKEFKMEGLKIGADDYITKPFDSDILEMRVKNLLETRMKLKQLFSKEITLEPTQTKITSRDEKLLNKLMETIDQNLDSSEFGITELASILGISRAVLYRKVKALTNMTVIEFINTYKLKKAAQFLSQNNLSISEIAYAVGYSDPKYFSKRFKEVFDISPTEYADLEDKQKGHSLHS